jgi:hypothetical protein
MVKKDYYFINKPKLFRESIITPTEFSQQYCLFLIMSHNVQDFQTHPLINSDVFIPVTKTKVVHMIKINLQTMPLIEEFII